jgi:hypothetical protein
LEFALCRLKNTLVGGIHAVKSLQTINLASC